MITKPKIIHIVKKIQNSIISERKTDKLSLYLSREVIDGFKLNQTIFIEGLYIERGDEYAVFDFTCVFVEDDEMEEPFSINAYGDMEDISLNITYNPEYFPFSMNDLVGEVKETIEHELEHVEQQNFEDMSVYNNEKIHQDDEDYNFKYLISKVEIPAYVRGLIKRSKTKKMNLNDTMDEWAMENRKKFKDFKTEWPVVKQLWMDYAIETAKKQKIKKFK